MLIRCCSVADAADVEFADDVVLLLFLIVVAFVLVVLCEIFSEEANLFWEIRIVDDELK